MACSGGRIVAVGSSDEVRRLGGADTREVDLKGLTVIPGLTDAHVHLADHGLADRELVDVRDFYGPVNTIAEVLARLSEKAGATPAGDWVIVAAVVPDFDANQRKMGIAFAVGQALERGVTTIHAHDVGRGSGSPRRL